MNYDDGNDGDYYGDDSYDDDPTPLFLEDFLIPVHLPHPICLPRITSQDCFLFPIYLLPIGKVSDLFEKSHPIFIGPNW